MSIEQEAQEFSEKAGVEIPRCLVDLYIEKGNGGFGPDYGLIGIVSGHKTDMDDSILSLYQSFCTDDPDDPNWSWPKQYIPFIHIGCGIHFCIDQASKDFRVVEFDPTDYDPDVGPQPHFKELSSSFSTWVASNV